LTLEPFAELKGFAREVEPPPDLNLIADELLARMEQLES
jgi:hypothetical protein